MNRFDYGEFLVCEIKVLKKGFCYKPLFSSFSYQISKNRLNEYALKYPNKCFDIIRGVYPC